MLAREEMMDTFARWTEDYHRFGMLFSDGDRLIFAFDVAMNDNEDYIIKSGCAAAERNETQSAADMILGAIRNWRHKFECLELIEDMKFTPGEKNMHLMPTYESIKTMMYASYIIDTEASSRQRVKYAASLTTSLKELLECNLINLYKNQVFWKRPKSDIESRWETEKVMRGSILLTPTSANYCYCCRRYDDLEYPLYSVYGYRTLFDYCSSPELNGYPDPLSILNKLSCFD